MQQDQPRLPCPGISSADPQGHPLSRKLTPVGTKVSASLGEYVPTQRPDHPASRPRHQYCRQQQRRRKSLPAKQSLLRTQSTPTTQSTRHTETQTTRHPDRDNSIAGNNAPRTKRGEANPGAQQPTMDIVDSSHGQRGSEDML